MMDLAVNNEAVKWIRPANVLNIAGPILYGTHLSPEMSISSGLAGPRGLSISRNLHSARTDFLEIVHFGVRVA